MCASGSGVTRLVAPGPEVAMQTPTLPVACAYPVAAWPAPCSWRTSTCRIRESNSGSYSGRVAPPGMPKATSTPTASRERTRLCAPVMPVAGSAAASAIVRATVSTPRVAAAAASLGVVGVDGAGPAPGVAEGPGAAALRPVLLVVLISTISLGAGWGAAPDACRWSGALAGRCPANKKPLVPDGTEGWRVGREGPAR